MIIFGAVVVLLIIVAYLLAIPKTPQSNAQTVDWETQYGNYQNWAYGSSNKISASNVGQLSVKWFSGFPVQEIPFFAGGAGPLLTLKGFAYLANWGNYELYSYNVATGNELYDVVIPYAPNGSIPVEEPYFHTESSMVGTAQEVWLSTPWLGIFGYNSLNGNLDFSQNLTTLAAGQDGNKGAYQVTAPNFAIDQQRKIMVTGLGVNTTGTPGRGFVEGWSIGSKSLTPLWGPVYLSPPQDGSDPQWSVQMVNSIPHVYAFNGTGAVDLKKLSSSQLSSMLSNDWTSKNSSGTFSAGPEVNSTWVADSSTGITYIATTPPTPVSYSDSVNGPGILSSSIIALDSTNGHIRWVFQVTPHDVWGWGCKGNIILTSANVAGSTKSVVVKECENGYLFVLDASNGSLLWSGQLPGVTRSAAAGIPNIMSSADMQATLASKAGNKSGSPSSIYSANIAYDPASSQVYGATGSWGNLGTAQGNGTSALAGNSTFFSYSFSKPGFAWNAPITGDQINFVAVSNGLAYAATHLGELYVYNAKSGASVTTKPVGMSIFYMNISQDFYGNPAIVILGASEISQAEVQLDLVSP